MTTPDPDGTQCALFADMTLDERQQVLELVEHETYSAREVIIREGLSTQILWIIVRGRCEVVKLLKDKSEKELAGLRPGSVFGEMSFFHPAPHSASVRALTDVEVMRLSRERFDQLCESSPPAALKITESMVGVIAQRLRCMDDWMCDLIEQPDVVSHQEEWQEFRAKLYADWEF